MKFLDYVVIQIVTGVTKTALTLIIDIFNGPSDFWEAKLSWHNILYFDSGHKNYCQLYVSNLYLSSLI